METITEIDLKKDFIRIEEIEEAPTVIQEYWDIIKQEFPSNIVMIRRTGNKIEILPVSINTIE